MPSVIDRLLLAGSQSASVAPLTRSAGPAGDVRDAGNASATHQPRAVAGRLPAGLFGCTATCARTVLRLNP